MAEAHILEDIFNNLRENMASLHEGYLFTNISIWIIVYRNSTERVIELTVRAEIRGFHLVVNADEITSLGYWAKQIWKTQGIIEGFVVAMTQQNRHFRGRIIKDDD